MPRIGSTTAVVDAARQVIAGTGLSGGGDLTADRTLAVAYGTTTGTVAQGNDTRFGKWDMHTGTPTTNGQTPVWNGSAYVPGTPPATMDAEQVRDIMGVALVGGSNVTVTVDDGGDTITISAASGGGTIVDATTTTKGIVQLAGDLGGTAAAPTVPNKVGTSLVLTAGTGLTGGGNLTANRTFAVAYGTTAGTALQGNMRDSANGVAPLDGSNLVPQANLPRQTKPIAVSGPFSGTITLDAALGASHAVSISGNATFAGPINAPDGFAMRVEVRNTTAVSYTVTFSMTNLSGATLPITLLPGMMLLAGMYWSARESAWFLISASWET
jgi:hypothetical protein